MDEHVITIRWVDAPDEIAYHDYVEGTYNSFSCTCDLPLPDRVTAAQHASEVGRCLVCLGAGTISINPHHSGGCETCGGSGTSGPAALLHQTELTESLLKEVAALLPEEFGLREAVALVEGHVQGGAEAVLSVTKALIRCLEVQGEVVLYTVPDFVPGEGVEQRYDDPRWLRVP
uniref:Uncharacterized protein n=2 Tax=Nonomuraea gerenzanensis TaxID=93944 RepID=A0A1M4ER12_9ACTN|nr:hypothetical protein BN4615_P10771 [Nonomuraea gerenzanensis]